MGIGHTDTPSATQSAAGGGLTYGAGTGAAGTPAAAGDRYNPGGEKYETGTTPLASGGVGAGAGAGEAGAGYQGAGQDATAYQATGGGGRTETYQGVAEVPVAVQQTTTANAPAAETRAGADVCGQVRVWGRKGRGGCEGVRPSRAHEPATPQAAHPLTPPPTHPPTSGVLHQDRGQAHREGARGAHQGAQAGGEGVCGEGETGGGVHAGRQGSRACAQLSRPTALPPHTHRWRRAPPGVSARPPRAVPPSTWAPTSAW